MNQLEFFVASTECTRAEVRRYLRQLRELDELIEYHLECLRFVTEQRVRQLAEGDSVKAAAGAVGSVGSPGEVEPSRKRRRTSPPKGPSASPAAAASARRDTASSALVLQRPDLLAALDRGTPSSARRGLIGASVVSQTELTDAELQAAYVFHRTRALRHAGERRTVAAELTTRGAELKGAMAARLAQFESSVEAGAR